MGHLRIGSLPRTRKWSAVVSAVASATAVTEYSFSDIAEKTLEASKAPLRKLPEDLAFQRCFQFLVVLAIAGKSDDVKRSAEELGLIIEGSPTKFQLSKSLRVWLERDDPRYYDPEFASLARQATTDTIAEWLNQHLTHPQLNLFPQSEDPYAPWQAASSGKGFCRLSRHFFANFLSRYLNYFLSRVASSQFQTLADRKAFANVIEENSDLIAEHAFETSKLVQSFSAGWFNKHASEESIPSLYDIQKFLTYSFEKIREEFRRQKETG